MFNRGHWKQLEDTPDGPRVKARNGNHPTYGVAGEQPTLATQAVLLGTEALTTAEVAALLAQLFRDPGITTMGGPAALLIRRETAFTGLPVPLHPGVETFRQ